MVNEIKMAYIFFNPNCKGKHVTDCVVRAICRLENLSWLESFDQLTEICRQECDMPSSDKMWGLFLHSRGYTKHMIPEGTPFWYSVRDFCTDHPVGSYIVKTSGHVIAVVNGDYYDTFDSGDKYPIYYWRKEW